MGVAVKQKPYYTPDKYLALEREANFKSQYFDGQIYAMAGGSPSHNNIGFNLAAIIKPQMHGKSCRGYSSDQKVCSSDEGLFSYPDITIVCGEPKFHDQTKDVLINPKVIVEVLSPSSEAFDRGKKFAKYKQLETFTDYILIAQDEPQIDYFIRQSSGDWLQKSVAGLNAEIYIASIDCTLRLSDVYDLVEFPPKLLIDETVEDENK